MERPGHALLVTCGAFLLGAISMASERGITPNPYLPTLRKDVETAIRALKSAKTASAWLSEGFTPESIFGYARDLRNPQAWEALCSALKSLPMNELAYFDEEIRLEKGAEGFVCGKDLLASLSAYWRSAGVPLVPPGPRPEIATRTRGLRSRGGFVSYDGGLGAGEVALAFEGIPDTDRTSRILATLAKYGVHALFFERSVRGHAAESVVQAIIKAGHTLGNSGEAELPSPGESAARAWDNIRRGRERLESIAARPVRYVRFPYGCGSDGLEARAREHELTIFYSRLEVRDWQITDPVALGSAVRSELERVHGGLLILNQNLEQTVLALPAILDEIAREKLLAVSFAEDEALSATQPSHVRGDTFREFRHPN